MEYVSKRNNKHYSSRITCISKRILDQTVNLAKTNIVFNKHLRLFSMLIHHVPYNKLHNPFSYSISCQCIVNFEYYNFASCLAIVGYISRVL